MKKIYENATVDVVALSSADVIKTSSQTPDNEVDAGGSWE